MDSGCASMQSLQHTIVYNKVEEMQSIIHTYFQRIKLFYYNWERTFISYLAIMYETKERESKNNYETEKERKYKNKQKQVVINNLTTKGNIRAITMLLRRRKCTLLNLDWELKLYPHY